MKIKLKAETGPLVRIVHGDAYDGEFHRDLEPFDVPEQVWEMYLKPTGLFEEFQVPSSKSSKPKNLEAGT